MKSIEIMELLEFFEDKEIKRELSGFLENLIVWIPYYELETFTGLFPASLFWKERQEVALTEHFVVIEHFEEWLDYVGVHPEILCVKRR